MGGVWLEQTFLQVLHMSLTGTYCILAVLLVRLLLKKQPKIFSYLLWAIVLFRLVCPLSFESPFSLFHLTDASVMTSQGIQKIRRINGMGVWTGENERESDSRIEDAAAEQFSGVGNSGESDHSEASRLSEGNGNLEESELTEFSGEDRIAKESGIAENSSMGNIAGTENSSKITSGTVLERVERTLAAFFRNEAAMSKFWITAGIIWLLGFLGMTGYAVISAVLLKKKLKAAQTDERLMPSESGKNAYGLKRCYVSEQINTPFVFGILCPSVYLPAGLSEQELPYILEHERTHIRRGDHLVKPLAFLVLGIHWFNPLVWLAFSAMSKDMEMSCDEAVLRKMGKEIKQDYSASLLSFACGRTFPGGSPLAFGEGQVKGRIRNILNYKKPGFWGMLAAVILLLAAGITLMSDPRTTGQERIAGGENTDAGEKKAADEGKTAGKSGSVDSVNKDTKEDSDTGETSDTGEFSDNGQGSVPEKIPVYQKEEQDQLKEMLARMSVEEIDRIAENKEQRTDMVVLSKEGESNLKRWMEFCKNAKKDREDAVLILEYTIEGDPVLEYLSYKNGVYYWMQDTTRDRFGEQKYQEGEGTYLKGYFDDGQAYYYLTDQEELTLREVREYQLSGAVRPEDYPFYVLFSFPYQQLEPILTEEEFDAMTRKDLEFCITQAVLSECADQEYPGKFQTEAHHNLKIVEEEQETTAYTHVLYVSYESPEEEVNGSYIPTAITFSRNADGAYQLKEYWIPEDGSYYKSSLEEKFPEDILEYALDGQHYVKALQEKCDAKAVCYFSEQGNKGNDLQIP